MKANRWSVVRVFPGWVVALAIGGSAFGQGAAEDDYFLPPDYQQAAPAPEPVKVSPLDKLELRSVSILGETQLFSIFDTNVSKGVWIELNETVQGITVSDYNKGDGSVLVKSGGFTRRLKLKEAKIIALAAPSVTAPATAPVVTAAAGMPNMTTGTAGPVNGEGGPTAPAINNLSDDEVRARMQRVAEEIRRRRAMRREMAEQATQSQQ
jgi:hypothetical protein